VTRLLLVDSEPENRTLLRDLLLGQGCEVDEARHGAEALARARQSPPDLVISDLRMPVMDGYTLLRRWKADDGLRQIPFVVCTAAATDPKDESLAVDLGADAVLHDPDGPEPFMARIREVLAGQTRAAPSLPHQPTGKEKVLEQYSEVLVRELEEKALQLERANRELLAREARLRAIFETEPECVKLLAADGSLLEMNPAGLRMIDADSFEEVGSHCVFSMVVPEHREAFRALTERVFRGETGTLEFEIVGLKGSRRWLETHASPLRDADGAITALLGITRDITERKESEAALRRSEAKFRAICEASPLGIFLIDPQGLVTYSNPADMRLSGLSWDDSMGLNWSKAIHPDDRERVMAEWQACHAAGRPYAGTGRYLHPDGKVVRWEVTTAPVQVGDASLGQVGLVVDTTERSLAEERLRLAVQASNVGLWDWDLTTDRVVFSREWKAQLGYAEDEIADELGEWQRRVHPDDLGPVLDRIQRSLARPEPPHEAEFRMRHRDGTWRWIYTRAEVLRDGEGKPVRMLGGHLDVTDRKRAAIQIEHLNRVYAVLSEINQALVRGSPPSGLFESACRIAVEAGRFRMAWIGLMDAATGRLQLVAHAGATPDTIALVKVILEDGTPDGGCALTRHAHGSGEVAVCNDIEHDPRSVSWRAAALERGYRSMASLPLRLGETIVGTFNLYAGEADFFDAVELRLLGELAADVSFGLELHRREEVRRGAEQALRASEERFRELAETIEDVFWISSPDRTEMLYVSKAYESIWGRSCASLYASPESWLAAVHPDDRHRIQHAAGTRLARGDYDEEYRIVQPGGAVRWIRDLAFPVRNGAGAIERIVGVARDITDRRAAEEQLLRAQKLEGIGQLAGGVAHDFNNILAVILMQADLVATRDDLPEAARSGLEEIRAAAERAAGLTRQLLLFGRRQVMQPRELDLNETVGNIARMLQRIIGEDVRLDLRLHPASLVTRADAGMLDQLLMNLAVNARDAMPEGGQLLIETSVEDVDEAFARLRPDVLPGRYVRLSVSDTGVGIPAAVLPRIFEPFFSTKEPGKGTGLGLATVFGIVRTHRGWLDVKSEPGHGAHFRILLPASEAPASPPAPAAARPSARGGAETILLVEDERPVRHLMQTILARHGYQVLTAENGPEALRIWGDRREEIALLVTDLVMPGGVGGEQLARRLREESPRLGVVFVSGYSAERTGGKGELRTGESFLQKPFSPERLLEAVRRTIDG